MTRKAPATVVHYKRQSRTSPKGSAWLIRVAKGRRDHRIPVTSVSAEDTQLPKTGVGSGCHLRVSLWKDGEPASAADGEEAGPAVMRHAVGGLVEGLPGLTLLCAPTVNSYRRHLRHSPASAEFTQGYDNRACAVRVTGHGRGRHLEIHLPGADANAHLALSAVLTCMVHGLTNTTEPPQQCSGDAYEDRHCLAVVDVPRNLGAARPLFEDSAIAREALARKRSASTRALRTSNLSTNAGTSPTATGSAVSNGLDQPARSRPAVRSATTPAEGRAPAPQRPLLARPRTTAPETR